MKVALLNTSDTNGGAAVVTMRLTEALRHAGHDAKLITLNSYAQEEKSYVTHLATSNTVWRTFMPERIHIFARNGWSRENLFKVSTAEFGVSVSNHPWVKDADVIVLNWINQGLLSIGEIERLGQLGKPIVWIMHDLWCMTGICHHPYACTAYRDRCGNCQFLHGGLSANDLSRAVWNRKSRLFEKIPIHFVAVSRWVEQKCRESALLADKPISVIHHAFPLENYSISCSPRFVAPGIDPERNIILMGAARLDDPIKGLDYAIDAFNYLFDNYPDIANTSQAVFFGGMRDRSILQRMRLPYAYVGPFSDIKALNRLYSSSSVILSTSLYETLGATLVEGQASGCVPVSFGSGGQTDVITKHKENGYIARYQDTEDVAQGIVWALSDDAPSRESLRRSVEQEFALPTVTQQYVDLFESLLAN